VTFGSEPAFSVGIEEEFFLVDAETLETVPIFDEVVPDVGPHLKPELFACIVEATTPPCPVVPKALEECARLRWVVAGRAASQGATILAAGTHPLARGLGQPIVNVPRYRRIAEELGDVIYTQLVCGLHVHVAMPDADSCLRAFEGVVPWLPVLLSLSANSPFAEGEATGLRSSRAERLLLMPTGGTPPLVPDWAAWDEATAGDDARRHWDAWPRPGYGTLEVRVMDQQTNVGRTTGLAALVQALAAAAADRKPEPYDRAEYTRRRALAARQPPTEAEVAALAELVEPVARRLGTWDLVEHVLTDSPEAERQLELGPEAALREAVSRSVPSPS
jgi:carboxylate-amine ligase